MGMNRLLSLHALSPVHSGTGHAVAVIDLPISREKATGWPQIPGSSIKGVLRAHLGCGDARWANQAFGDVDQVGDLVVGDQRILCLAVRSYYGTFAYVTCPLALTRLRRDLDALHIGIDLPVLSFTPVCTDQVIQAVPARETRLSVDKRIYLEDLDLTALDGAAEPVAAKLAELVFNTEDEKKAFKQRFLVVPDDIFTFLCETATVVTARIRLQDETKTVAKGGLWYEEAVPAESIFTGPLLVQTDHADGLVGRIANLDGQLLQFGGDASIGRGLCRVNVRGN